MRPYNMHKSVKISDAYCSPDCDVPMSVIRRKIQNNKEIIR